MTHDLRFYNRRIDIDMSSTRDARAKNRVNNKTAERPHTQPGTPARPAIPPKPSPSAKQHAREPLEQVPLISNEGAANMINEPLEQVVEQQTDGNVSDMDMKTFMRFVVQSFTDLNTKVDSISTTQASLQKSVEVVSAKADTNEQSISDLKDSVSFNADNIKDLEDGQEDLKTTNKQLKKQLEDTTAALSTLQLQVLRNERHSRAFNVRFLGIDEVVEQERSSENCIEAVQSILKDRFDIDGDVIETAHRTGKHEEGRPRQIIARFYSRPVRYSVMRKARDALDGTGLRLTDDLCAADLTEKKRLKPLMDKLYAEGKRPAFRNGLLYAAGRPFRNTEMALMALYSRS